MKALTLLGAMLAYSVVSSAGLVRPRAVAPVNPFQGKVQFANPEYVNRVNDSALSFQKNSDSLYKAAINIRDNYPTWTWLNDTSRVPKVTEYIDMIEKSGNKSTIATFVIYNLPNRECGATKPHGNLSNDKKGEKEYKTFIDNIRTALAACDEVPVALIIEPEAITNLIEYKNDKKCDASVPVYKRLITYAIKTLDLPYVHLYLDGGNSGMLGLDDKIHDAAEIFTDIYKDAGSPTNLRGLSINVGRNSKWSFDECPKSPNVNAVVNNNCDDRRFVHSLSPLLSQLGWKDARFIIDESRAGVPPPPDWDLRIACNIMGTGFGLPPGSPTNDSLVDAFVWAKPGGESDGTSDENDKKYYDPNCSSQWSLKPSPEYGAWFEPFFQQLIESANPPIGT